MSEVTCTNCAGHGYNVRLVTVPGPNGELTTMEQRESCSPCGGSGKVRG